MTRQLSPSRSNPGLRRGRKATLLAGLIIFVGTALPAASDDATLALCPEQTLVMGSTRTLGAAPQARSLIFETLIDLDETGNPVPKLARSWQISDDGLTYTFALRSDVHFHDGTPFTAAIAAESIRAAAADAGFGHVLDRVEASAPHTLEIILARPYWPLLNELAFEHNARMALRRSNAEGLLHRAGTGPFRLLRHAADGSGELMRNNSYWNTMPKLERLLWRAEPDPFVQVQAFGNGELDVIGAAEHHGALPYPAFRQLEAEQRFEVRYRSYGRHQVIDFNVTHPVLSDARVRQAIATAIDRTALVTERLAGLPSPTGILNPGPPVWPLGPEPSNAVAFDTSAADALLTQAGWQRSSPQATRARGEQPLALRMLVNRGEANAVAAAGFVKDSLAALGVELIIDDLIGAEVAARLRTGNFQLHMSHSCSATQLGCLGATGKYTARNDTQGLFTSPFLDTLIMDALGEREEPERHWAMQRVWVELHGRTVSTALFDVLKPIAVHRDIADVRFGTTPLTIDLTATTVSATRERRTGCLMTP